MGEMVWERNMYHCQFVIHKFQMEEHGIELWSSGFGGLVVSMLASGTQVRGFKPDQSRPIFRVKKSSACLPSEGK
jgi:hypothetical protein